MDLTHQQDSTSAWSWLLPDDLGSVRGVVNANNMPLDMRQFTPYGEPIALMGSTASLYGFTGEQTDPNGLVHLRARNYLPELGVFPSLDRVMGTNRYGYVAGDPVNRVDPSGWYGIDLNRPNVRILPTFPTRTIANATSRARLPVISSVGGSGPSFSLPNAAGRSRPPVINGVDGSSTSGISGGTSISIQSSVSLPSVIAGVHPVRLTISGSHFTNVLPIKSIKITRFSFQQNRCMILREYYNELRERDDNGPVNLARLIDYANNAWSYDNTKQLADDISCAVTGNTGSWTVTKASRLGNIVGYDKRPKGLGDKGWHKDYADGEYNQDGHFWTYVNTTAQGGLMKAYEGNNFHECWDISNPGKSSQDYYLGMAGIILGYNINAGNIPTNELDEWILTWMDGEKSYNDLKNSWYGQQFKQGNPLLNFDIPPICPFIDRN